MASASQPALLATCLFILLSSFRAQAQPVTEGDAGLPTTQAAAEPTSQPADSQEPSGYRASRAISTGRSPEPVSYARPLSDWGEPAPKWLLMGIEQRTRYEYFDDNYQADLERDQPFLLRSRAYLGVQDILDPLRLGVEFQDSREFNNEMPGTTSNVDENDFLQAFAELYFADALGPREPLSFQVGRIAVDYVDRRLKSRNGFRNTTNAFDGFRLRAGDRDSKWELEAFAAQPVAIRQLQPDRANEEQWFYGIVGAWRGWAPLALFEPYYFILDQDNKGWDAADTELHTFGLHAYGDIGRSGFDYDLDAAFQCGKTDGLTHRAFATHAEVGYTFEHAWKPRVATWLNYAEGDHNPNDSVNETFNRLFGSSNRMYGILDYFIWSNMIQPSIGISAHPTPKTHLNAIYRAVWLASENDSWSRADRVDPTGQSGDFVGQEIDLFVEQRITDHCVFEIGYGHFMPGNFVRNTGDSPDSDRFYVQTTISF
ncbi:MAG TPA: alginate export family protein [Phycisphaerae bacterium]|nr:alginate export family protein [Phycisphaerae bacterium]